jgi:uncharacterized protein YoxC
MNLEIGLFVMSISLLLLAVFAVPALIQVGKTARKMGQTVQTINQNLPCILTNVGEIATDIKQTNRCIQDLTINISHTGKEVERMVEEITDLGQAFRNDISIPLATGAKSVSAIIAFMAAVKGIRAFRGLFGREARSEDFND